MLTLPHIPKPDQKAAQEARRRQDRLTKPTGSLGCLEDLSIQMAAISGKMRPSLERKAVIVMAADHGVAIEGVSAYPAEVTPQMVLNFLHGGAAINVLSRLAGARVVVVDIGVAYDFGDLPGLVQRKIALGTHNLAKGPAMQREQAERAIQVGVETVENEIARGLDLVGTGDMGIGNTTASAAITAVFTGLPPAQVTGRGTGIDVEGLARKVAVIQQAIELTQPDPGDPLDVLAKVGGFEIAGLAGVVIGAAAHRVPVVIDGFISAAAALVAAELVPEVKPYLIASHQSVEVGQGAIFTRLGLHPLLNLGMRLGEGTGSVLAFHLVEASVRILNEMATFDEAGVSDHA
jgi:nicotinate-nucleotide--dimethylbenzimidazole phosphoribosyltransferase